MGDPELRRFRAQKYRSVSVIDGPEDSRDLLFESMEREHPSKYHERRGLKDWITRKLKFREHKIKFKEFKRRLKQCCTRLQWAYPTDTVDSWYEEMQQEKGSGHLSKDVMVTWIQNK